MAAAPSDHADHVIVATRFSHLRIAKPGAASLPAADLPYEALSALAEALDLLSRSFTNLPKLKTLDPARAARLAERAVLLADRASQACVNGAFGTAPPAPAGSLTAAPDAIPL